MNDRRDDRQNVHATIHPGDTATLENVSERKLSITLALADGASITLELQPQQTLEVVPGESRAEVILRSGDPGDLLVIQPDQP